MLDDQIPDDLIKALQLYCTAFFTGCKIEIKRPGDLWEGKALPKNFYDANKIKFRDDDKTSSHAQAYTVDILNRLVPYKKRSTYAILGVTMVDLYPGINWNYVFGWANFGSGSGVFSFKRYHPDSKYNDNTYDDYIRLACHTMAHEIGHMFGIHHCAYYECIMNGYNSMEEQLARKNNTLCPVCLKKLQSNIQFDTKARFEAMLKAVSELGFEKEVEQYTDLLKMEVVQSYRSPSP